jgi:FkbM family methyltransferase
LTDLAQLDDMFARLIASPREHGCANPHYQALAVAWAAAFRASSFAGAAPAPVPFGPFGTLTLPYRRMGAIDSVDLFGLDELILFAFYWTNRARYRRVVDIGANIGLHSIMMARCGFAVRAFEPDPVHLAWLRENLQLNGVTADVVEAAVSDRDGATEFIRVKGNTTGSHLAGAKAAPYGELDRFPVTVRNFADAVADADLVKIDAEGHEAVILRSLPVARWQSLDALVEIGTAENARALFDHFEPTPIGLFAQKTGWGRVVRAEDMPTSHREGSVFVSAKAGMPW